MDERKTVNIGEKLADWIESQEYGTIIHYQDIENVTGEVRKTSRYYGAIAKAKTLLIERGKAIKLIGGGDYQIIYPGDYSSAYVREIKLAKKRVKCCVKILKGAPKQDMTLDELQTYNNVSDFHKRIEASMDGSFVEIKELTGKRHPLQLSIGS